MIVASRNFALDIDSDMDLGLPSTSLPPIPPSTTTAAAMTSTPLLPPTVTITAAVATIDSDMDLGLSPVAEISLPPTPPLPLEVSGTTTTTSILTPPLPPTEGSATTTTIKETISDLTLETVTTLIPFGDMLNHQRPRQTKWTFDRSTLSFNVTAVEVIVRIRVRVGIRVRIMVILS
jgi:hypothetical protein